MLLHVPLFRFRAQGYPTFDLATTKTYFAKVNEKLTRLIQETIRKWDLAAL